MIYDEITGKQLKALLEENGLDSKGSKKELWDRAVAEGLITVEEPKVDKYAKYATLSQQAEKTRTELVTKNSRFEDILDAEITITDINYRSDVQTRDRGTMQMVTVRADANAFDEEGNQIPHVFKAQMSTNVKWLKDYNLEIGMTKHAKIGLVDETKHAKLASDYMASQQRKGRIITLNEAKAIIPLVEIIFDGSIQSMADIIERNAVQKLFRDSNEAVSAPQVVTREESRQGVRAALLNRM